MSMMGGSDLNLTANVDANVGGFDRGIGQAVASLDRYEASIRRAQLAQAQLEREMEMEANAALRRQHDALDKTGRAWFTFGAAAVLALGWATNEAIKWESAWTGVTKTTNGSAAEMGVLEDQLRSLSLVLPSTHEEIAAVAEAAGQLGVAREDIAAFTKVAIDLGQTTNLSAEDAATSIAQFMNVMGTAAEDVDHVGNTLVALGNKGASTESQIMAMALRLVGAGKLIGATDADVLGLAAAMSNLGIQSELGGGAAQRMLLIIYNAVQEGGDALQGFADIAGVSGERFAREWSEDPLKAFDRFTRGLGHIKDAGGNVIERLDQVGIKGTQNLQVMLRLAGAGDQLTTSLDQSSTAWEKNNALVKEAEKKYETTESKIAMARNELVDSAIDVGNLVLPALAAVAGTIADIGRAWQDLPGPLRDVVTILGIVTAGVALFGGAAMIAVPKIAAFKVAVDALEAGALKTAGTRLVGLGSILTGPWGLAIAGAVTAVGLLGAKHGEAAQQVEALKQTLDEQTGAITDNSREWAIKKLSDSGVLDAAKEMGLNLGMVTEAALGNKTAMAEFTTEYNRLVSSVETTPVAAGKNATPPNEQLMSLGKVRNALEDTNGTLSDARDKWQLEKQAKDQSAGSSKKAADAQDGTTTAWKDGADAAGELTEEVQTLGEELADLSETYLNNRAAGRAVRDQLRSIAEAVAAYRKEHGDLDGAFKQGSKSGDQFGGMLDELAQDYQKQIQTVEELGGSEKRVQGIYDRSRAKLMEVATQLLGSKAAAKEYVDQVLQVPGVVQTHFLTEGLDKNSRDATAYLWTLGKIDGYTATAYYRLERIGNMQAEGALPTPGGTKKADGGFSFGRRSAVDRTPRIARGGDTITWAEPETGWEAYISGKPGMEGRSKAVWAEAGRRLGINEGRAPAGRHTERVVERVVERHIPTAVVVDIGGEKFNGRVRRVVHSVASAAGTSTEQDGRMDW